MERNRVWGPLSAKLGRLGSLDKADQNALHQLSFRIDYAPANKVIVSEGDSVTYCRILIDGYAFRHKTSASGNRQIVSFHMPGDIVDLDHLLLSRTDYNFQTMTSVIVAKVSVREIVELVRSRPALGEALWRATLVDASIFREWVLNIGRRDAKSRIAHLLCEFAARRELSGLGAHERFEFPMTQGQIADATGLTAVHVNRMLAEIEAHGVISRDKRLIEIKDWRGLCDLAEFEKRYLHAAE